LPRKHGSVIRNLSDCYSRFNLPDYLGSVYRIDIGKEKTMSNITKGIPAELAAELANLANRIEAAVREDERKLVLIEKGIEADKRSKALLDVVFGTDEEQDQYIDNAMGVATGMHGEPLEPVKKSRKLCRKEQQLIVMLKRGFQAAPTLAGNLGVSKQYVYAMIHNLKRDGMNLEIRNVSGTAARYQKIYRLAKTG